MKELFSKYVKDNYKGTDFEIEKIKEDDNFYFCYLHSTEPYDVPVLVLDKKTNKIKEEILPPFTDDSKAITIYEKKQFNEFKKKEEK